MKNQSELLLPMQALYQTLLRLMRTDSDLTLDKTGLVDADHSPFLHVVGQAIRLGEYDPRVVLPCGATLVHALAMHKNLPLPWLEYFVKDPEKNGLFESHEGKTLGDRAFVRMVHPKNETYRDISKTLLWWVQNAPLDPAKGAQWLEIFNRAKPESTSSSYGYGSEKKTLDPLISALQKRGVVCVSDEVMRPQDRWTDKPLVWAKLVKDERMSEWVVGPSGRPRALFDYLLMVSDTSRAQASQASFAAWASAQGLRNPTQPNNKAASHGRRKELVDTFILHPDPISIAERAIRASVAMDKVPAVAWELAQRLSSPSHRRPAPTKMVSDILAYRTPSGMSLAGWFRISQGHEHAWPQFEGIEPAPVQSDDGQGLIMQMLRLDTMNASQEFGPSVLSYFLPPKYVYSAKEDWVGSTHTHAELVDTLVDMLVAPHKHHLAIRCADLIIDHQLIADPALARKLHQARLLVGVQSAMERALQSRSIEQSPRRSGRTGTEWVGDATKKLNAVLAEVEAGQWDIKLTSRDWRTLSSAWSFTPATWAEAGQGFSQLAVKLNETLHSLGNRLAIDEASQSSGPRPALRQARL